MDFIESYFIELEKGARSLKKDDIFNYLLNQGYYPDRFVLPPCFCVKDFKGKSNPIILFPPSISKSKFKGPSWKETEKVIFPKSDIMDRVFGIIHPDIYHDLSYYISENWSKIQDTLFKKRKIYCYSFPIPIEKDIFKISRIKRTERLIYEYIEMAEHDLVADSLGFDYIIHADIKNFYPSVYTHSIAWAIHGKNFIQDGRIKDFTLIGNILDILIFSGNGGSTNGIPIGSIVSDILSEIVLSDIDAQVSDELDKQLISYKGVRYKDDYRILCKSEDDGKKILKVLQKYLFRYNLSLNENKTLINNFPEGLYRPWILEYDSHIFAKIKDRHLTFKEFEQLYFHAVEIHKKYPSTGILKKFLGQIISKENEIKIHIENRKNALKLISLIWKLRKEKIICLPEILGIFELLVSGIFIEIDDLKNIINDEIQRLYNSKETLGTYEIIWLSYFIKTNGLNFGKKNPLKGSKNMIFKSINCDKNFLFGEISKTKTKPKLFTSLKESKINYPCIFDWVGLFR